MSNWCLIKPSQYSYSVERKTWVNIAVLDGEIWVGHANWIFLWRLSCGCQRNMEGDNSIHAKRDTEDGRWYRTQREFRYSMVKKWRTPYSSWYECVIRTRLQMSQEGSTAGQKRIWTSKWSWKVVERTTASSCSFERETRKKYGEIPNAVHQLLGQVGECAWLRIWQA